MTSQVTMFANKYCVYRHYLGDTIIYVGMGAGSRPFEIHGRNGEWKRIIGENEYKVEIVKWFLTREIASMFEKELIRKHKPKANLTNHGHTPKKEQIDHGWSVPLKPDETRLTDYLIDGTQQEVADALKITQGAVYQMVSNNRDVRLILNNKGKIVRAKEIKIFPTGKHGTSSGGIKK